MREVKSKPSLLQVVAVVGPVLCLVHCLAMPLLVGLLPLLGSNQIEHGPIDQLAAVILLPLCALAVLPGYRKHGQKSVLIMLVAGCLFFLFGSFFAGQYVGESAELPVMVLGSVFLVGANLRNRSLLGCSTTCCADHPQPTSSRAKSRIS